MTSKPEPTVFYGVECVLWDWSGTLCDDENRIREANNALLKRHGEPVISLDDWRRGIKPNASSLLAEKHGLSLEELYDEFSGLLGRLATEVALFEGAREILESNAMAGIPNGIISSHPELDLFDEIVALELGPYITHTSGSVVNKEQAIQAACTELGVPLERTIYVGDTAGDITAAHAAGVRSAALTHGYSLRAALIEARPDALADSLTTLQFAREGLLPDDVIQFPRGI